MIHQLITKDNLPKIGSQNLNKSLTQFFIALFLLNNSLVWAQDDHAGHDHDAHAEEDDGRDFSKGTGWGYGILFSFIIGVIGFVCSVIVVLVKTKTKFDFKPVTDVLIAFAAGALLGDAFAHLIPSGFGVHSHGDENVEIPDTELSVMILTGIVAFFLIEKVLESVGIGHTHGDQNHNNNNAVQVISNDDNNNNDKELQTIGVNEEQQQGVTSKENLKKFSKVSGDVDEDNDEQNSKSWKGKKSEGYLNLIGDFIHNILDGVALGAIFSTGIWSNCVSTLVAIIAHEIPQEIGDVGILLHSKFSPLQVLICNGVVNFSAIIGAILGLALGELGNKSDRFLSLFIAGNFIYIGACDMIPTLKEQKNKLLLVLQILALCAGIGVMYLVTLAEDDDHEDHAGEEEDPHAGHDH